MNDKIKQENDTRLQDNETCVTEHIPQVSVCMPMYNASKYLRECIDSVLAQTFKDFEFLIVDDGSDDDSVEIVKSYHDDRIRLIQNTHDYIGSLNILLDEACGKYIARMDADDVMVLSRLERQFQYLETNPDIDILGGAMLCIGNTREQIIYYNTNKITVGDLLNGTALGHPSVMMRVKSITSLRYERQYIYAEDFRLWCQALKAGLKMTSLREVVIKYRFTGHNVSCAHALKQREAALSAKADLEEWVTASEAQYATKCATSMSPHKKMLTIIVTFLNEGVELERTIEGIRHTVGDTVDIIVINDCSYDGYSYGERLSSFDVRYVVNRHRLGVAASRDLGVKLCKTPYFLLLDAHMRFYDNSWADRIVEELRINERQILCCQGRVLYKDEHSGEIVNSNNTIMYGAYSPFQKDGIWPDITWNYKEKDSSKSVEDIPFVLGAAYAASKKYWQHLYGLKGLHNYGADEQYISLKAWLEGGRCTLLKDVIIGHIYRKKAPYLILGRDTVYNLMYIAKLLFPPNMYSKTVATSLSLYRDFANEALETFEKNKIEIDQFKKCLNGIFERTFDSILPMHQWCREYDIKEIKKLEAMLPNIAQNIQEKRPLDNGLMEGKAGVLIWLCHYGRWNTDACINDIITELFSTIETYVEEQRLPWNFRYGLSGIGWGVLYLYFKGLINVRPDYLIDQIDKQLCVIHPESIEDYGLDAGAAGILAYLTLRLTIDYSKFQKFPLDQWYAKAKKILRADTRQEVIYYAHLFISIYEEKPQKLEPLIGVWLNAPKYLPEKISNSQYTLADGVLGTTLQIMLILQNSKQ